MANKRKTRRANGLGGIRWNESRKRYEATITLASVPVERDEHGHPTKYRQRRRTVTAKTQAEVEARLAKLRAEIDAGHGLASDVTVERFTEHWIADVLPLSDVTAKTRDSYAWLMRTYVLPHVGHVPLDQLRPAHVRTMLRSLDERGLSRNTLRLARSVLRRALRTAEADGLVQRNAAAQVDGVRLDHREGRTLTPGEARRLLEHVREAEHEHEALIALLLSVGLRRGEALGLGWADVKLGDKVASIRIARALKSDATGALYLAEPKTKGSRRTIHLAPGLVDVLRRHRARQRAERLAFGPDWGGRWAEDDLVFTSSIGTPLDPTRVTRIVREITTKAGLGPWSPHELRHSAASLMLAAGTPLKVVSETLGHASIRITADTYAHLLDEARVEAAEAMQGALWG